MSRLLKIITILVLGILLHLPSALFGQWTQSPVINQGFVTAVAVKDSIIFLGGTDLSDSSYSYFYSTDFGESWTECFNPIGLWPVSMVITEKHILIGEGMAGAKLIRTPDWGVTWEDCTPWIDGYSALAYSDSTLYAGTTTDNCPGGVWKSTDNGHSWDETWQGACCRNKTLIAIDSMVFVGTGEAGIYGSYDFGNTWAALNTGLPDDVEINSLIKFNDTIFAGTGWNYGIYYSTDWGNSWQAMADGLDGSFVVKFAADHNHLFAATTARVYMLQPPDMTWLDITGDLPGFYMQGLAVCKDQLLCYGGDGLWSRSISGITGVEQASLTPEHFVLGQNYPNPFNPVTTITYTLPSAANVSVKVYDVLGCEIAEPVNGFVQAGRHSIEFDGSDLSSGIYFYSITVGQYRQVRKMLLVK